MKRLQKEKLKINGEKIVFHGSSIGGLKEIHPHKCKHNESYIYASENLALCVIFAVKRTGENIEFGVGKNGVPFINEFYEGAFEDRFKGRSCYIYLLAKKDFSFETEYIELVSKKPVKVLDVIEIPDAANYLQTLMQSKRVVIGKYNSFNEKEKRRIHEKLLKTLEQYKNFKILSKTEIDKLSEHEKIGYNTKLIRYQFCKKKFPEYFTCN